MKTRNLRPCGGAGWGELEGALDPWLLEKRSQGSPFNFLGLGMAGRELHPPEGGVAVLVTFCDLSLADVVGVMAVLKDGVVLS